MSVQHKNVVMALLQQYSPLYSVLATMLPNTRWLSNLHTHLKTAVGHDMSDGRSRIKCGKQCFIVLLPVTNHNILITYRRAIAAFQY